MSRLIDADLIDFKKVFVGASEFTQDTRNGAQMLIDAQPTVIECDNPDTLKEVWEKSQAKKVIISGLGQRYCPNCGNGGADYMYCKDCGQKLHG